MSQIIHISGLIPNQTGKAGKILMTDGVSLFWADVVNDIPTLTPAYPISAEQFQSLLDDYNSHTHTESEITDLDKYSQSQINTYLAGKLDKLSYYATTLTNLTINGYNGQCFKAEFSTSQSFSFANIVAGYKYYVLAKNTHATDSITITLPTAAGHIYEVATINLPAGMLVLICFHSDGTKYIWEVSPLLTETT